MWFHRTDGEIGIDFAKWDYLVIFAIEKIHSHRVDA